jgi:hypothetical protein
MNRPQARGEGVFIEGSFYVREGIKKAAKKATFGEVALFAALDWDHNRGTGNRLV